MGTTLLEIDSSERLQAEAKGRAIAAWAETFRSYGRLGEVGTVVYDRRSIWVRLDVTVDGMVLPLKYHQPSGSGKSAFYVEYPGLALDAGRPLKPVRFTDPAGLERALQQYHEWEAGRKGQTVPLGSAAA